MLNRRTILLRIIGIALGTGLLAFLIFEGIFEIPILAFVVGVMTLIFFLMIGGLVLVNMASKERYYFQLNRMKGFPLWRSAIRKKQVVVDSMLVVRSDDSVGQKVVEPGSDTRPTSGV